MPDFSEPTCPSCLASLPEEALDRTLGVAQCPACGEVSELGVSPSREVSPVDREVEQAYAPEATAGELRRRRLLNDVPSGWTELSDAPLSLRRTWLSADVVGVVGFAAIWNLMICGGVGASPSLLCMPHAWLGLAMIYYVVVRAVNRTAVVWDGEVLEVRHGPLPWLASESVVVRDLEQVYVEGSSLKVNKQPRWNLMARGRSGEAHVLLRWLSSTAEARWLESRLEDAMGVVDRPVDGEIERF